ncbi:hypothetical protein GOODEAATRI_028450 [Goodea atripinnis]|uniref:Uncharacterized protein n=1 Tax=Goodea atripinnis TaxID=208336 RepID=A0ABV0N873_9TELE
MKNLKLHNKGLYVHRTSAGLPPLIIRVSTMAGFRQEDVELYYEMGEELGRYEPHSPDRWIFITVAFHSK